ncbi:MAG: DUF971 family protein [Verrucomicrobiales bacterium]|jgi:DUF971 family protein
MVRPDDIQMIGDEVALRWSDGSEDYFKMELLRARSPSAENIGERDLTGKLHGGTSQTSFPGVQVTGWQPVGGYAIQFEFSDGHRTGLFAFDYLKTLASVT